MENEGKLMKLDIIGWDDIPDCERMNFFIDLADLLQRYSLTGVFKP